jgi:predicted GNAT family N-acyltransferase
MFIGVHRWFAFPVKAGRDRPGFSLEVTDWRTSQDELFEVRREVYIVEQAVPPELELDEHDAKCVHVLARDAAGRPIGTGRLLDDGHVGRVAVVAPWRKRGVGGAIVRRLLDLATGRGIPEVVADAQVRAIGFYERLGFSAEGGEFMDAGIPHRRMRLRLTRRAIRR